VAPGDEGDPVRQYLQS